MDTKQSREMVSSFSNIFNGIKPVAAMVIVQALVAGVNICYKLSVNDGMNMRILIAYRFIFATAFVAPIALVLERSKRPRLTWKIAIQGFLSGLFGGALGQNLYIESLALTSTTFAVAMSNLIPAATFLLAIAFRLEKLGIATTTGKCKLTGTVLSIVGAMILTSYKGREINLWSTNINLINHQHNHQFLSYHQAFSDQLLGSILAISSCLSYAIWYMIQAKMSKNYPCQYSSTALTCCTASIQSTIFALVVERDWSAWKFGWNIRLFTAIYTGTLATGLTLAITTWCIRIRGPFFVSIFGPLVLIFVAFVGSLILQEMLHIGSFLGAAFIIIGVYAVSWGKSVEMNDQLGASKSSKESETSERSVPCCKETSISVGNDHGDCVAPKV